MKRQQEVVQAFINAVYSGEMSKDEAIRLMENQLAYPGLTEKAKDTFYAAFADPLEPMMGTMAKDEVPMASGLVEGNA